MAGERIARAPGPRLRYRTEEPRKAGGSDERSRRAGKIHVTDDELVPWPWRAHAQSRPRRNWIDRFNCCALLGIRQSF